MSKREFFTYVITILFYLAAEIGITWWALTAIPAFWGFFTIIVASAALFAICGIIIASV